ncbi:uncharacterized protein ACO6RY_04115 [Pungitius sinensis]
MTPGGGLIMMYARFTRVATELQYKTNEMFKPQLTSETWIQFVDEVHRQLVSWPFTAGTESTSFNLEEHAQGLMFYAINLLPSWMQYHGCPRDASRYDSGISLHCACGHFVFFFLTDTFVYDSFIVLRIAALKGNFVTPK